MKSLQIVGSFEVNQHNIDRHAEVAVMLFKRREVRAARLEIYLTRQRQWHSVTQLGSNHPMFESVKRKFLAAQLRQSTYGWNTRERVAQTIIHCSAMTGAESFMKKLKAAAKGHTARLTIGEASFEATTKLMKNGRLRTSYRSSYWSGNLNFPGELHSVCADMMACDIMTAIQAFRADYLRRVKA